MRETGIRTSIGVHFENADFGADPAIEPLIFSLTRFRGERQVSDDAASYVQDGGSVTACIAALRQGDQQAIEPIWNSYFPRLVNYARTVLGRFRSRFADEEDAALSALATFWQRFAAGQFPNLRDREGLWKLLSLITVRKVRRYQEAERTAKRGGGANVTNYSGDWDELGEVSTDSLDREAEELLEILVDDELRSIALLKLMECTNPEIAEQLGISLRSVERKLRLIRTIWLESIGE